ncbi:methyl-accepting chemotaxis protein [Clostridium peptidivorans]|uniref:methyl-accepting chemotaxis protein n=1 Tax=Clostridium peptidivorans TaxID=100174 RepID=UPI000BE34B70|nr:methyl-accepting chemotaxis protein [Clostridium peptidivorans]
MKFKIGTKIVLGFAVIIILTVIIGIFSYVKLLNIDKAITQLVQKDIVLINKSNEIRFDFSQQTSYVRGYILTNDESYVNKYSEMAQSNAKLEKELYDEAYTEEGKKIAEEVKKLDDAYSQIVEGKVIPLIKAKKNEEALTLMKSDVLPLANKNFEVQQKLMDFRMKMIYENSDKAVIASKNARTFIMISSLLTLIIGLLIAIIISRVITKPIKAISEGTKAIADGDLTQKVEVKTNDEIGDLAQIFNKMSDDLRTMIDKITDTSSNLGAASEELLSSSEETTASSRQVADTITQLASGASNQSIAVEETSTIMEELSASTQQVAGNIDIVSKSSIRASEAASDGLVQVEDAINKIKQVQKVSVETVQAVTRLGKKSEEIDQIVEVIKNIADQTNLLALNAAIEAARAGEHGRGFAVVAEEVRKLAEQSGGSAKQIASLVENIQLETKTAINIMERSTAEVNGGVEAVNVTGSSFNIIVKEIDSMVNEIQSVAIAAKEMAQGSDKVVHLIESISVAAEETASNSEEVAAAAEEQTASMESVSNAAEDLTNLGVELQNLVSRFKL